MENLKIKLATGKIITIEAFHFTKTYGGLLTGEPSKEINQEIIKNISYPKNWGQRRAVFDRKDWYLSNEELKPVTYSAWLTAESIDDKEKQYDGSSIIVIWMMMSRKVKPLKKSLFLVLDYLTGKNLLKIIYCNFSLIFIPPRF